MNADAVISQFESDFEKWGTELVLSKLVSAIPFLAWPIVNPIVSILVGHILVILTEAMDLRAYFVFKTIKNNLDAGAYQDAIASTNAAAEKGDPDEITKAEAAQKARFAALVGFAN